MATYYNKRTKRTVTKPDGSRMDQRLARMADTGKVWQRVAPEGGQPAQAEAKRTGRKPGGRKSGGRKQAKQSDPKAPADNEGEGGGGSADNESENEGDESPGTGDGA